MPSHACQALRKPSTLQTYAESSHTEIALPNATTLVLEPLRKGIREFPKRRSLSGTGESPKGKWLVESFSERAENPV
jgi:hypothetical protein